MSWINKLLGKDGVSQAVVKVASTAAVATDEALVVAISPNNSASVAGARSDNTAVPGATNVGVLPAVANAAAPAATEANLVLLSTDLTRQLRVLAAGGKTNNNAAPGATNVGALTVLANAAAPTWVEGNLAALSADLSGRTRTDMSSVAGTATSTAAAGVQKVGVVGNANAAFDGAIAAVPPANALQIGLKAATANPANATAGNQVAPLGDKAGRLVVTPGNIRENIGIQTTTITASTAETTIITAGAAGVFNDISCLVITTTDVVAATITFKDATAGTTRMVIDYPGSAAIPIPLVIPFPIPVPQAVAAANWTATVSVNAGSVHITAVFVKNL